MAKLKRTLVYPDGFGTYDVEADDEAGLQDGINDIDQQFETHTKAKANLAELNAAPIDRKRGLFAGADPTMEEPDLRGSGLGAAFEAGGQAWQRGVGRVAGNLAAVPSVFDRALDDVVIPGDGPMEGTSVRQGVPLYAGKRMLDAPQTDGGPAMLSGVADDLRHGLPEMPSGYSRALAGKSLGQKLMDPTWYADMLAGNAPQMGVSLAGGAIGGRPGAAAASGLMMAGDEFQRTQDYEEETGRRAENAGLKALLSGGLQGALDSIVPGSIATGGVKQEIGALIGTVLKEGGTEGLQKLISDMISPAEQRSFGDRMTDPKYLMELAEEGVAGGIMGGAMHPLGQSGLRPTQPNSQTLKRTPSPADIIEGRDGTQGMQPVDMVVPVEKGPSAAVAPNPDRSARMVPADTPVPPGMAFVRTEDGILIYDPEKPGARVAAKAAASSPEGLAAFLAEHGAKPTMAPFVPRDEPAPRPPKLDGTEDGLYTAALSAYKYATEAIEADPELSPEQKRDALAKRKMAYDARVAELDAKYAPYRAPVEPQPPQPSYFDTIPPEGLRITPQQQRDRERSMIANNSELTPEMKEELLSRLPISVDPTTKQPSYFDTLPPEGVRPTPAVRLAAERSRIMGDATLTPEVKEELLSRLPTSVEPQPAQPSYFDTLPPGGIQITPEQRRAAERSRIMGDATLTPEQKDELLGRVSAADAAAEPLGQRSYFDTLPPGGVRMTDAERSEQIRRVEEAAKKEAEAAAAPKAEPKKEGLAERKKRERAEAEAAEPKPEPKPEQKAEQKAETKPEPKPVAKEAPVAQPVQQPQPAVEAEPSWYRDFAAQFVDAQQPKAAPVSTRVVATIPTPKTPEVVAAEKAEREAAKTAQPMMDRVRETQAKTEAQPVPPHIADYKLAAKHTPKQLKAAEQLVVLAYHSERTAEDASRKYAAEREVERAERDARAMGVDVDAISRSVGRETREVTPQVTAETSPFMQARRAAEAAAAKEVTPEPKPEPKKKTPKPDAPKTVEKKLAAAVAKERALRAKRDADPENEALLDEYNEATAELYALTKEAAGKGVSTLDVTKDDDTPSLMKTLPQREARAEAFPETKEPMSREAFDKALEDAKKRLPGIAHLVDALDSQADLPSDVAAVANGDRIDGFTQNGRVAVVADGMTSPEHVAATLAHEAVGHLVPEQVFGKNEWRKRLNDMMASSQWFRDFVANFGKSEIGSRYKAAELASEAVAFEANKVLDDANYKPPNAYRMFIAKLREWLREAVGARRVIGLSKVLEFSDRDLAAFIARSKRTAEAGLPKNRRKGDGKPSFAKAVPGAAEPVATAYSEADLIDVPPIEGFDIVRRAMEDDMLALRRAEEAADKRGTSREEVSMYKASDERHGKAATEIQDVRSQFVTPIIKMAHKAGVTLDEIGDWLYASHALARNAEGRKRDPDNPEPFSGKSDEWAIETLTRLDSKGETLDEIANVVYAMLAYERKRIVEAGLATKEEVEGWRKTWGASYVPLQHQEMDEARSGNARGYNVLRRAAKQATGRRTEADNPLFSAISQVQRSITRAHNAEVGRQFDLFVQANPNPEYWIRNPKPKTKTLKTKENEDGELETKVVTVAEPTFMRDDILHIKDKDGNDVEIQILHPDVLRAMTRAMSGLGNSNAEKVVAFASAFTRIYGGLLTQYNLEFLISNPARDVQGAAANISVGYGQSTDKSGRTKSQIVKTAAKVIGQYGKSAKGIIQFMRDPDSKNEYAQLYAQMRREGATVGWAPFEDPNKIKNQIQSDMNSLKRGALHPKEWLKKANEVIHAANTIAENATRLSVYKTLGDLGITGRERVRITKNSTVNFNRRGEYGPIFNAAYMFGQVGISAPAAMLGFVKKSPKRAAKVAATLAMAGWAEGFLNILFAGDDDEDGYSNYEELQESDKSRNWIFGKKKFPLAHGWSFFVNFGRHVAETQFGPREMKDLPGATFVNLMDSFNPLGASADPVQAVMPWFLDPMVQHYGNKTTFGAPIYPPDPASGQPTVPDSREHFRSAPKWATTAAKGLSAATGGDGVTEGKIEVSPETLQFYYDFATQGAVKLMTRTLAAAHNAATGTETRTSDIPFVRRLATSEHPSLDRGRYIRQKQELTDAYDRAKKYKGLGPKGEEDKNLDRYNDLLAGPLRSRSDFMKLDKLYAQLDDAAGPEVEALKKRVIAVAGRQYELSKKVDKYIPLDEGLISDIEEKVEALSPKKEKVEAKEEIEEDLENR